MHRKLSHAAAPSLFDLAPDGLTYQDALISIEEENRLLKWIKDLPFEPFQFRGYTGKRRVLSYGWRYDFAGKGLSEAPALPEALRQARNLAAALSGLEAASFVHVLITEYASGAGIGWHRDKPAFGDVVGISLASACTLRFRRRQKDKWQRYSQPLSPRSGYVLRGPARDVWEHSIASHNRLRYSITFRTLRAG